jgi:hypothetical protein
MKVGLRNPSIMMLSLSIGISALLAGCALTPSQVRATSTSDLCRIYSAPLHDDYMSPKIRNELAVRGETTCTDPAYVRARSQAAMSGFQNGLMLMNQSRRQPVSPSALTPTVGCFLRGERISGMYKTCFYSCAGGVVTSTVGTTSLCSLNR